jgi:transcriptional regulator with XRE-family HTH domain
VTASVTNEFMAITHPLTAYRNRQNPRLSQKALANILGKDRITILRWENGQRKPEGDDILLIQRMLGITPRELRPDLAELIGDAA